MTETVPIPEPPGLPIIGNLPVPGLNGGLTASQLADTYGPILRVRFAGRSVVIISNNELINEACDEKRFHKSLKTVLRCVREGVRDGLFTALDGEEAWDKAHRVLIPAFGPLPIRSMFDEMYDISSQLAMKLARHGPSTPVLTSDDFTRLALDTIALCSMGYRFNSFYHDDIHPFVQAMSDFLVECQNRNKRPSFVPDFMYRRSNEKFWADIATMRKTADDVVGSRRENPSDRKDLLTAMLTGVDPRTGERLTDDNITDQLITFLIAGHETTSGLLCFSFYNLLKHPEAYRKVQQEVDEVVGLKPIRQAHIPKFPYIAAVLRETLRLSSTIPAFALEPYEDTLLAGKYAVAKGEPIQCLLARAHLDPVVFGDDAKEFKPERMLEDNFARLNKEFPNCWKPFGNGKRGCIGRPFAWQEAILCVAMLFQNFNFVMDDPNYQLQIVKTLTIKPGGFRIRASMRHGMTPTELEQRLAGQEAPAESEEQVPRKHSVNGTTPPISRKPMAIYYGSNSGTCEAMAQRVAADAPHHGFSASTISPLDSAYQNLTKDRPVVIVTASYEGKPPSNAGLFVSWLESLRGKELEGVNYAVYGCGHRDWIDTFHRIPKLVDSTVEKQGGYRLVPLSVTDAADRDMFSDFEAWEDELLWPVLKEKYGTSEDTDASTGAISVEVSVPRKHVLRQDVEEAMVLSQKTLTTPSAPAKKHVEIQLPTGMRYKPGDYLAVLPLNPRDNVSRVLRRFELPWDASLRITADIPTTLPTDKDISAVDALSAYVELSQPATKRSILTLIEATQDKSDITELESLAGDKYQNDISSKRVSVLDLLERFPSIALPFSSYLAMLPPMRVRHYSISSSPLIDLSRLTLTYSLLDQPSLSGQGRHIGVATSFLSSLHRGDKLHVAIRPSASAFHLPTDVENTPLVCIGAGSGIAPFRGFIQERAAILAAGRKDIAPALLFFGCRDPEQDDLYADQLAEWEALGAADVRRAYSRAMDRSHGCRYVQDRLYRDREDVWALWEKGAKIFVCGGREVGRVVEDVCIHMAMEASSQRGKEMNEQQAKKWFASQRNERYVTDVFD